MPLILNNKDVEKLLTMELCMEALEYAYAELGHDRAAMGPVLRVASPIQRSAPNEKSGDQFFYHYSSMAGVLPGWNVAANRQASDILQYTTTPTGPRLIRLPGSPGETFCGLVLLHEASSGQLLAVIHDGFLQKTRVAGLAGVAAKYLARKDANVLAVIGSGWQASAQIDAHCIARPIKEIRIYSPTRSNRESFAAEVARKVRAKVIPVDTPEIALRGAAIVATATNSLSPVLRASWLEPGMFITSVKELEFEPKVYDDCDLLVANRRGPMWSRHVVGGAKSIPEHGDEIWYKWTQQEWEQVRLLGPIVAGIAPGRTNDQETIAFMNQGEGLQFAAVGRRLYDLAMERGLGTQAPFDWFHQGKEYGPGGGTRQAVAKLS